MLEGVQIESVVSVSDLFVSSTGNFNIITLDIVSMDMAAWIFLHTTQCLVFGGTSYASVCGTLRGLYMAGDLSLCICLCDHEVLLVMSTVIQATGWQIVHILVWPHLMLSFA